MLSASDVSPFRIERSDGDDIGQIYLMNEIPAFFDDFGDIAQSFKIQGIRVVDIYGAGHTADEEVGVRIFPAENRLDFYDVFLYFQCFEVMCNSYEIDFGR